MHNMSNVGGRGLGDLQTSMGSLLSKLTAQTVLVGVWLTVGRNKAVVYF